MEFISVDLISHMDLCLKFRRDTHLLSYGDDEGFDVNGAIQWFKHLSDKNPRGFKHIVLDGEIVGQLEFKSGIRGKEGAFFGYINLIYLIPELRGKGLAKLLQNYVLNIFKEANCTAAHLRYLPENKAAGIFYFKHGWQPEGDIGKKGQLMVKQIA